MHYTINLKTFVFLLIIVCLFCGCKKSKPGPVTPPSTDKKITAFNFPQAENSMILREEVIGSISSNNIILMVPPETDLRSVRTMIAFTGRSVTPANSAPQNFTTPVNYTVTAEDGSTMVYTVTVKYRRIVFICSTGAMCAFDGLTGETIWKVMSTQFTNGTPSFSKGTVFISGNDGLYALDAKTGVQLWKYTIAYTPHLSQLLPSPVVVNNTVFISYSDGYVYAFNAINGTLMWRTQSNSGEQFTSNFTSFN